MSDPKIADLLTRAAELGLSDEAKARELIKKFKVRSFKRLAEVVSKNAGAKQRVRRSSKIHSEGPRGFKFGPVWLGSIKSQKGIALSPSNLPKLRKTAESKGVATSDLNQEQLVAALAKVL